MKVEIKKLIQSAKQSHYFIRLPISINSPSELRDDPEIKEIIGGKKVKFSEDEESNGSNWYLIVDEY